MSDQGSHGTVPQAPVVECPSCGSTNGEDRAACWSCSTALRSSRPDIEIRTSPDDFAPPSDQRPQRRATGLSTMRDRGKKLKRLRFSVLRKVRTLRRIAGTGAVILAGLVALVPGLRDDVGDRFDRIYEGTMHRLGQLADDELLADLGEVSSVGDGTDPTFLFDASTATGWSPAPDDAAPKLVIDLPQRPDVNYLEIEVRGPATATIAVRLLDTKTFGQPLLEDSLTIQADATGSLQRLRVDARVVDQIELTGSAGVLIVSIKALGSVS